MLSRLAGWHMRIRNMSLIGYTKRICGENNIKPSRSKGQNFLIREEVYNNIVKAADLKKEDIVLEVGSGLGFLTEKMARKVKKVIAVELDDRLAEVFWNRLAELGVGNVEVINKNILDLPLTPSLVRRGKFKVVANLPYNITSIFLRKILSAEFKPSLMVLMLQKEVAKRIDAQSPKMSLLAVSVQFYAKPEIIQIVPASNFWPEPEVDSALIKLKPHPSPLLSKERGDTNYIQSEREFFRLVRISFSAKRKMLKNNLANGYHRSQDKVKKWLGMANFSLKIRAQNLSLEDWLKLFGIIKKNML